jgi:hypothetical protein
MRFEVRFAALAFMLLAVCVLPARAQYVQIYKLDNAAAGMNDSVVLKLFSERLSVPAETLGQEKSQYNLTFGQLYMAHAIRKATNKSFDAIMSEIKSGKAWSVVTMENNVRMQSIDGSIRDLEKTLKRQRGSTTTSAPVKSAHKTGNGN